jgi:hypothetical protein
MNKAQHLYLFTLEIQPLGLGETYNSLPSHLTLISRFYTYETPEQIIYKVDSLFNQTKSIDILFQQSAEIGPKQTPVHLIKPSLELKRLHAKLIKILDKIGVTYTEPMFIGDGWKPHVSKRENNNFSTGEIQCSRSVYLIEVFIYNDEQLRVVRNKSTLAR